MAVLGRMLYGMPVIGTIARSMTIPLFPMAAAAEHWFRVNHANGNSCLRKYGEETEEALENFKESPYYPTNYTSRDLAKVREQYPQLF